MLEVVLRFIIMFMVIFEVINVSSAGDTGSSCNRFYGSVSELSKQWNELHLGPAHPLSSNQSADSKPTLHWSTRTENILKRHYVKLSWLRLTADGVCVSALLVVVVCML